MIQMKDSIYKTRWEISDLPDLTDEDIERSLDHTAREWAFDFSAPTNLGKYIHLDALGIVLQNAGNYCVRCIWAMDHVDSRIALAMFKTTFEAVNVQFEMGEYTIVIPCEELAEEDKVKQEQETEKYGIEVI